jgi:hypothetical protein
MGLCEVLMRPLAAAGVAAVALSWSRPGLALEQDEWLAAAAVSGNWAWVSDGNAPGLGLGLEGQRGLSDLWAARGAVEFDLFREPSQHWRRDLTFEIGAAAAFDVLRAVPFVEAGVALTLADLGGDAGTATRAGLHAGLGVEYLIDRAWSVGGVLRGRVTPLSLAGPDGSVGLVVGASLRLARRF